MNLSNQDVLVSKKYAQAFLRVYGSSLSYDDIKNIETTGVTIRSATVLMMIFRLALHLNKEDKEALNTYMSNLGFPESLYNLIHVLMKAGRLFLLPTICHWVVTYFRDRYHIFKFLITSSHALSNENKDKVEQFLKNYTQSSIEPHYEIDRELIAGVRMQSKIHLWEKSIAQQLRDVQLKNMR